MPARSGHDLGLTLDEAAWKYGPARLRRAHDKSQIAENELSQQKPTGGQADPLERIGEAFSTLAPILDGMKAQAQSREELREILLNKLRTGNLIATGYPIHATHAHEPTPIEPFLFQMQYAKWSKSQFVGHGRHYELVRVFKLTNEKSGDTATVTAPVETRPRSATAATSLKPTARSVGRPNVRSKITEIALEIIDSPDSPTWQYMTDLWPRIRAIGSSRYPDSFNNQGPKDQVMRNGINDAFDLRPHLRKNQKL